VVLAVTCFLVFYLTKKHLSVKYANWFQRITFSLLYSFEVHLWKGVARILLFQGCACNLLDIAFLS